MWPYATLTDLIYYLLYTLRSCEESPPAKICAFFENSEESWQFFEVSIYFKSKKSPSTFSLQVFTSFSNIASDDIESRASSLRLRIQRIPHQTPLFLRAAQIGSTHSDHSNGYLIGACQRWVHGRSPAWVKPAAELCCNSQESSWDSKRDSQDKCKCGASFRAQMKFGVHFCQPKKLRTAACWWFSPSTWAILEPYQQGMNANIFATTNYKREREGGNVKTIMDSERNELCHVC